MHHRAPYVAIKLRCPTCKGRKLLWLQGGDYIECATCEGRGAIEAIETRMQGLPRRAICTDTFIERL